MLKGGLYLAMGDSVTWTAPAETNGYPYPSVAWDLFNNNYSPIRHINKGYGGQTSSVLLQRYKYQVSAVKADLVTVCVGMNDCNGDVIGVTTFENNLKTIVDRLRQHNPNVEIILCNIPPTNDPLRTPYVANYRAKIVSVATAKGTFLADFSTAYTNFTTYAPDGIHANNAGHSILGNILYGVIQTTSFAARLSK